MGEQLIFYFLGGLILFCSVMVISTRNPVTSALFLIGNLFSVACLYALLGAHFVAAIQVLVYAGAIMVLFLFVIMLLNLRTEDLVGPRLPFADILGVVVTLGGFIAVAFMALHNSGIDMAREGVTSGGSSLETLWFQLFTQYLWPFELASFLILLAIVATVVIGKKDKGALKTTSRPIKGSL